MANLSKERIRELEKAELKLRALENAGVDNWDGYGDALDEIRKEEEYDTFIQNVAGEIGDVISESIEEPAGMGCGFGLKEHGYELIADILKRYKLPMQVI